MKLLKCLVGLNDGNIITCDGISYKGKLWLVPSWLEDDSKPTAFPERIIRFDNHPHQEAQGDALDFQNILLPMSESALCGEVPQGIEFEDHPQNLEVPIHLLHVH